jgi:hypothetical protein
MMIASMSGMVVSYFDDNSARWRYDYLIWIKAPPSTAADINANG